MRIEQSKTKLEYETIITDGIITYKNPNTTLGFVRFNELGEVEYIFVTPMYRKKGIATSLLNDVRKQTGVANLIPQEPISPLGRKLFKIL